MASDKVFVIKEGVTVTEEVVAIISGLAACEIDGVHALGGELTADQISKAGAGKLAKGVRILRGEEGSILVRLAVHIGFGYEIPTVCRNIQERVKSSVENMTGITVKEVDIKVASVAMTEA